MRRPGLRVAWASLFAALYLALPIGGRRRARGPRLRSTRFPQILDAFPVARGGDRLREGHTDGNEVQAQLRALVEDRASRPASTNVVESGGSAGIRTSST